MTIGNFIATNKLREKHLLGTVNSKNITGKGVFVFHNILMNSENHNQTGWKCRLIRVFAVFISLKGPFQAARHLRPGLFVLEIYVIIILII